MEPFALDPERWHVRIDAGGRSSLWPWWRLRGRTNPNWVFYANDRDGAVVRAGGRAYPLRALRVLVIPPDTVFDTEPGPGTHQVWFHVDLPGLPAAAARALAPTPIDLGDDAVLRAQAARLHATMPDAALGPRADRAPAEPAEPAEPSSAGPLAALAYLHQAVARLIEIAPRARRLAWIDRVRQGGPLAPALRLIEERLAGPIYVVELAARCGMGPQWFTARFRAATNLSPAQYVLERRTAAAARLLAYSDRGIDEIATACGFIDRSHFGRVFIKRRGIPPAAYRKRERRGS